MQGTVLCGKEAQNEKIKHLFLQQLMSQWEGWACKGRELELAGKLSKGPEVAHIQGRNFVACLGRIELLDVAKD